MSALVLQETIENKIFIVRGHKVLVDRDLAFLYGVTTKVLNQAVKRNKKRFPDDFMFVPTARETRELVTNCDRFASLKHSSVRPHVFTEQGVAMLSTVLHSERAILVNIEIMRAFVKLRRILASHKDLARRLEKMEQKYDAQFRVVFEAIRRLMREETKPKARMGFHP